MKCFGSISLDPRHRFENRRWKRQFYLDVLGEVLGDVPGDVLGDLLGDVMGDVLGEVLGNFDCVARWGANANVHWSVWSPLRGSLASLLLDGWRGTGNNLEKRCECLAKILGDSWRFGQHFRTRRSRFSDS